LSNELPDIDFKKPVWKLFPEMKERAKSHRCTECNEPIESTDDFKDELSVKEYSISGLCAKCQDRIFK